MDDALAWVTERRLWLEGTSVYGDLYDPAFLDSLLRHCRVR